MEGFKFEYRKVSDRQSEKGRGPWAYDARHIMSQKPLGDITDLKKSPRNNISDTRHFLVV